MAELSTGFDWDRSHVAGVPFTSNAMVPVGSADHPAEGFTVAVRSTGWPEVGLEGLAVTVVTVEKSTALYSNELAEADEAYPVLPEVSEYKTV
jgi:hypothetical protein